MNISIILKCDKIEEGCKNISPLFHIVFENLATRFRSRDILRDAKVQPLHAGVCMVQGK